MKKIVILGGGYAGVHSAKILIKKFKKDNDVSITLIDKNSYHTLMTELHEVAGNRVSEDSVKISYNRIFAGRKINLVQDEIKNIDANKQELYSENKTYQYDYLIMGLGAESADFNIPGVKEHCLSLWGYPDAVRIKHHIQDCFTKAEREQDPEKRRKLLTFVVAGSGFTGIEMVGELLEWLPILCKEHNIDPAEYSLINVEALGTILTMLPEKPRQKAQLYMEKKGVKFMLNSFIVEASKDSLKLKDGTVIACSTKIWTCGVCGTKQAGKWGLEIGRAERLKVDDEMRSTLHKNLFIVGDLHWALENDKPVPQIVEAAEQTAAVAAKNIISEITGKGEACKFKSNFHGFMVSIGGRYAVSHTAGISLTRFPAMAVKHLVNCYYLHTVCGLNGWFKYLKHEIFEIKNKRSLLGGLIAGRIQGLWAVPLRMWLGLMWLFEGINKIGEGWLNRAKGTSSAWMFSSGVIQRGSPGYGLEKTADVASEAVSAASDVVVDTTSDAVSAASDSVANTAKAVVETASDAVSAASDVVNAGAEQIVDAAKEVVHNWGPFWDLDKTVIPWDSGFVTWFRQLFMDRIAVHIDFLWFQGMILTVEILIGLALIGGLFTFPAAGVSIIMCFVFIFSGLFSWSQIWFIFAAFLMLGAAGRTLGLDYWVQPFLKKWWNGTRLANKTYIYTGEPKKKKKGI